MTFPWMREHRRSHLREEPFPTAWLGYVEGNVAAYSGLSADEQRRLLADTRIFIDEKFWEGGNGIEVTDEMKVTIASQACLLTLGLDHEYFPNVETVIVYSGAFVARRRDRDMSGVVTEGPSALLGEAWSSGPTIVSWEDALAGGRSVDDGHNVVLHEFAHKLDFRNGAGDGVPRLHSDAEYQEWSTVMQAEYEQLVDDAHHHRHSVIDDYGATNAAEFFAVATEAFFERSVRLRESHRRLYDALRMFYRQDTAARF